jgi:hypothetical protein
MGDVKRMRNKTALEVGFLSTDMKGQRTLSSFARGAGGTLRKQFLSIASEFTWNVKGREGNELTLDGERERLTASDRQ